jgi:hypothetical protein
MDVGYTDSKQIPKGGTFMNTEVSKAPSKKTKINWGEIAKSMGTAFVLGFIQGIAVTAGTQVARNFSKESDNVVPLRKQA